jgi:hypothetical protein
VAGTKAKIKCVTVLCRHYFTRRWVEVLWLQSHLFRHEGKNRGQAKPKHWHAISRKLSEIPLVLFPKQVKLGGPLKSWMNQLRVSMQSSSAAQPSRLV